MKRLFYLTGIVLLLCCGCNGVIDVPSDGDLTSQLKDRVDNLESRVTALEALTKKLNSNVEALQTIVGALQKNNYITGVEPIVEDGAEIGYRITFAASGSINVYHGKNGEKGDKGDKGDQGDPGKDGSTPQIGIRQDTDGIWYWTLDGVWLLDGAGNKVKAVGTDGKDGADGKDGITPVLKINDDGYWEVSVDNGETWQVLGKATGEQGPQGEPGTGGGDSIFKEVKVENGNVVFVLNDDNVYTVPMQGQLDIIFDVEQGFGLMANKANKIAYKVIGGDESTLVRIYPTGEVITGVVKPITNDSGFLYITSCYEEEFADDPENGIFDTDEIVLSYDEVVESFLTIIVTVSDGKGNSIMKALNFEQGVIESISPAYVVGSDAGNLTVTVRTNTRYNVIIEDDWISQVSTRAVREDQLEFVVASNGSGAFRAAVVKLKNDVNQTIESFVIAQKAAGLGDYIEFADPQLESACVARWDANSDGKLSYDEVALVNDVKGLFDGIDVTSFDEFKYFVSVKSLPEGFAKNCSSLQSITLPKGVIKIPNECFRRCSSLSKVVFSSPVESIGPDAFYGCSSLESIDISGVKELGGQSFANSGLVSLTFPEGLTVIPDQLCYECADLRSVKFPESLAYIGFASFQNTALEGEYIERINDYAIVIPSGVNTLFENAFHGCKFKKVVMNSIPRAYYNYHAFNDDVKVYVPDELLSSYAELGYAEKQEVYPFSWSGWSVSADCDILLAYENWQKSGSTILIDASVIQSGTAEGMENYIVEKGIYITPDQYSDNIRYMKVEGDSVRVTVNWTEGLWGSLLCGVYLKNKNGDYFFYDSHNVSCDLDYFPRQESFIAVEYNDSLYYAYARQDKSYYYLPVISDRWSCYDDSRFRFVRSYKEGSSYYAIIDRYDNCLYSTEKYHSFNVGMPEDDSYLWHIEPVEGSENNEYLITNKVTGKTVYFRTEYSSFGAYPSRPDNSLYPRLELWM